MAFQFEKIGATYVLHFNHFPEPSIHIFQVIIHCVFALLIPDLNKFEGAWLICPNALNHDAFAASSNHSTILTWIHAIFVVEWLGQSTIWKSLYREEDRLGICYVRQGVKGEIIVL